MRIKNIPLEISVEDYFNRCGKREQIIAVKQFFFTKSLVSVFLLLLATLALPSAAIAGNYDFRIKIVNKTNADLEIQLIKYTGYKMSPFLIDIDALKAVINQGSAQTAPKISAGESFLYDPPDDSRRKRKRRFELLYRCTAKHSPTENMRQYFPRDKKWYKRAHAVNNNNRYILKVKNSDC